MNRMMHWFTGRLNIRHIVLVGIFCVVIIFIALNRLGSNQQQFDQYRITRGDISESVVISGNANAAGSASIYSPSTGIVEDVYVSNGEWVSQGQEIINVQSTASEIDQANALATYQSAVAALNSAKQTKISTQSLLEAARKSVIDAATSRQQMIDRRNVGSSNPATNAPYTQNEIDSINSTYTSSSESFSALEKKFVDSDQSIAAAQSLASASWLSYQATLNGIVKSPIDGKVMNLAVAAGDYVKAKTTLNDIPPLFRIATHDGITIGVKLNEIDVAKVHASQSATVVFDALPDKTFNGSVLRVDTVGENVNAVVTYNAYIALKDIDESLRPAMTSTVTIQTDTKKGVLLVPNTALLRENDETVVRVQSEKGVSQKTVTIGMKNGAVSEVLSGLSEQDIVLVAKK